MPGDHHGNNQKRDGLALCSHLLLTRKRTCVWHQESRLKAYRIHGRNSYQAKLDRVSVAVWNLMGTGRLLQETLVERNALKAGTQKVAQSSGSVTKFYQILPKVDKNRILRVYHQPHATMTSHLSAWSTRRAGPPGDSFFGQQLGGKPLLNKDFFQKKWCVHNWFNLPLSNLFVCLSNLIQSNPIQSNLI